MGAAEGKDRRRGVGRRCRRARSARGDRRRGAARREARRCPLHVHGHVGRRGRRENLQGGELLPPHRGPRADRRHRRGDAHRGRRGALAPARRGAATAHAQGRARDSREGDRKAQRPVIGRAINVADYAEAAREKVAPELWCYFEGGAGDEVTLRGNLAAYERWQLRPRMLVDVSGVTTATTLLGTEVASPLGIAPFAMQGLLDPDGELATGRAAAAAGVLMTVSTLTTRTHAEIREAAGDGPRWFQLYVLKDRQRTLDHMHEAREAGYSALVLT